jgi:hypothetical protein
MNFKLWLASAALLLSSVASAEQFVDAGRYRVHYSAINSTQLLPDIARQFGVTRSRNEALLVLNAQQRDEAGQYLPVAATAQGQARSLIGHVDKLQLRPIREGEVHYVVASFPVLDGEFLTLDLSVLPQGADAPIAIKFNQQFYRN